MSVYWYIWIASWVACGIAGGLLIDYPLIAGIILYLGGVGVGVFLMRPRAEKFQ